MLSLARVARLTISMIPQAVMEIERKCAVDYETRDHEPSTITKEKTGRGEHPAYAIHVGTRHPSAHPAHPPMVEMAGIEPASSSRRPVLLRAQSTQTFIAPGGRVNQPPDGHSQLKRREHPANTSRLPQTLHTTPNAASRVHSRLDGPLSVQAALSKPRWGQAARTRSVL